MFTNYRFISYILLAAGSALWGLLMPPDSQAMVERIEIQDRQIVADGTAYGRVGSYVRISGRLHYAVDPDSSANASIAHLALAPLDARGRIIFSGDFVLLTPLDPARRNNRLLYDLSDRGGMIALSRFNNASGLIGARTAADLGNGFLLEQGYSILWSGWNWDVIPRLNTLTIDLPIATEADGRPIIDQVVTEIMPTATARSARHISHGSIGYAPIRMDDPTAQLSVRNTGDSLYTNISRDSWRFGRLIEATPTGLLLSDPTWITLEGGFDPGRIYRLSYRTRNSVVVGLGLAAVRDALSFFQFESADTIGNPNPLAENGASLPDTTLVFAASQSGRVVSAILAHSLHVDERGRMVFNGALVDTAGAGESSFNHRFAQIDDTLGLSENPPNSARTLDTSPRLFIVNSSTDYWARSASLFHTTTDGTQDIISEESTRIYLIAGAQRGFAVPDQRGILSHCSNPLDYRPVLRALLSHLDAWVTLDRAPPPSRHPRLEYNTLVTRGAYRERFPDAPFFRVPADLPMPPRLGLGSGFTTEGIADKVPPERGTPYITLVPAPDTDGMDIAGIRMPDISVPLGSHTGWNPQNASTGASDRLSGSFGSFIPFARTVPEREILNDPRSAITERYSSKEDYIASFTEATLELAEQELILGVDINAMIEAAANRYNRVMEHSPNDESCGYLTTNLTVSIK